jgi:hypothetical protein
MHRLATSLLLLLAGTLTFAQTSSNSPIIVKKIPSNTSTVEQMLSTMDILPASQGCPVGFFASRQATGQIISTKDATPVGPAQGLHLMLNHLNMPAIESIEVAVYGTSTKKRVLPVDSQSTDTVSKTFELRRTTGSDSLNEADIWMHQVGSLRWADLISVTYADGTHWHASENLKCRAVPSNLLLIGSR